MAGKIRRKIHRLVSLLTLCAFLFQQMSFASPPSLDIPGGLGKIETGKTFETKKIIFHIQDAHGNEDAQKNIQAILEHLTAHDGTKTVLLEGGNGKLHPELLDFFPKNPELNLKIADSLLKKAELTGAEKFLLTLSLREGPQGRRSNLARSEIISYGIENIAAYRENRRAFQKVLRARTKTSSFLSEMELKLKNCCCMTMQIMLNTDLESRVVNSDNFSLQMQ